MKIRKIEWHQVSSTYETELDEGLLAEIYPDLSEDEIAEKYALLRSGDIDVEGVIEDAGWDVDIDWDHIDDDWWTHRKGGYDVTYEVPESSEDTEDDEESDDDADVFAALDALSEAFDKLSDEDRQKLLDDLDDESDK